VAADDVAVDLDVTALVAGGDGLARHDGLAVFVPRTAVGDRVRARLRARGRFARASVLSVLVPSPDRVDAPCPHYTRDACGGCQWQHLALAAQRAAKARIVADAFARIARQPVGLPPVHGDAHGFGYRRTVRFTVRGRGAARTAGFHAAGDPDRVVDVVTCLLAEPAVQSAWTAVRGGLSHLPSPAGRRAAPRDRRGASARGAVARGAVARGAVSQAESDDVLVTVRRLDGGGVALAVEGGTLWRDADIAWFGRTVPACRGIWWTPAHGGRRLMWTRDAASPGAPTVVADDALAVAASFVQVNAGVSDLLHAHVLSRVLQLVAGERVGPGRRPAAVCDAYAGTGRLSVDLASRGIEVTAIERDPRAAAHAAALLGSRGRVLAGAVEDRLADALPAGLVVLNPPRGGCAESVCAMLARGGGSAGGSAGGVQAIVYVSCDPATLARDVGRLAGWRVAEVTCFDLFPQTAHVETVCVLRPEAA
jgi:23S rRNA (uracil1939-C5)-methyltransferase